jgi:hypothetical protein
MQQTIKAIQCHLTLLLLAVLVCTGCGQGSVSVSSSSSSSIDSNINGRKTSRKKLSRTHDGVTRKLETTTDVDIQNGQVTKFPKMALIKIEENGGPKPRQAELRENAGKLELWIKDNGSFRRSSAEEDSWLELFLSDVTASKPQTSNSKLQNRRL